MTSAVRPVAPETWQGRAGYRLGRFRDSRTSVPMLVASVSAEQLWDVFCAWTQCLAPVVDVILETSHDSPQGQHTDFWRQGIDQPVLLSHLLEDDDLVLNDGCTGIAVLEAETGTEIQWDEHKLLIAYAEDLQPFLAVLEEQGLVRDQSLPLICSVDHLHVTSPRYRERFFLLCERLGATQEAATFLG